MKLLINPKSELPPAIIQVVGLALMLTAAIVWIATGNFNAALFGGGGSLVGLSELAIASQTLHQIQTKIDEYDQGRRKSSGSQAGKPEVDGTKR